MLDEFLNALKDLAQYIWDQLKVLKHLPSLDSFNDFWKQSLNDPKTYGLFAGGLILLMFLVYRLRRNQTIKRRRMVELTEALEDDQDYTTSVIDHKLKEDPLIAELKTQLELPETHSGTSQTNDIDDGVYEEDLPSEFFEDLDGLKEDISANPDKFEEIEEPQEPASETVSTADNNVLTFEATSETEEPKPFAKETSDKSDIDLEFEKLEEELLKPEENQAIQPEEHVSEPPVPPAAPAEPEIAEVPVQASPEEERPSAKTEEPTPIQTPEIQQKPEPFLLPLEAIVEDPSPAPEPLPEPMAKETPESPQEPVEDPLPEPALETETLPDLPMSSFSPEDDSLPTLQTLENLQNEIEKTIKNLTENDDAFIGDEQDEPHEPVVSFRDPEQIIQKLEAFGESLENKINSLPNPSSDDHEILIDAQSPIAEIPTPPKKAVTMEVLESFLFIPKNKESDS